MLQNRDLLGELHSKDGKKYKLSFTANGTYGATGGTLVNWTNYYQIGDVYWDFAPVRAKVVDTAGTSWGWSINP